MKDWLLIIVTFIAVASFSLIFTVVFNMFSKSQIAEINSGKRDLEIIDEVINSRSDKAIRRRNFMAAVRTVVFYTVVIFTVPIFIFSIINKIRKTVTMIGNLGLLAVATDSMSYKNEANLYLVNYNNQFQQYDLIVVQKVEPKNLKKYDVIAFKHASGTILIHRIIEIDYFDQKITTRGDIYDSTKNDDPIQFDQVIGIYTGRRIPGIGALILFFQSYAGIITVVALIYVLFMVDHSGTLIDKAQEKRVKQLEAAIDYKEEVEGSTMQADFSETIYYKGYAYVFNESGFVEKREIDDGPFKDKTQDSLIKEVGQATKVVNPSDINVENIGE